MKPNTIVIAIIALFCIEFAIAMEPFIQVDHVNSSKLVDLSNVSPSVFSQIGKDTSFFNKSTDGLQDGISSGIQGASYTNNIWNEQTLGSSSVIETHPVVIVATHPVGGDPVEVPYTLGT